MSRAQITAILLAFFGGLALARGTFSRDTKATTEERPAVTAIDAAEVAAELASLREELLRTRARLAALERSRPAPPETRAERTAAPVAEEKTERPAEKHSEEMNVTLRKQLDSEAIDPAWSKDQEAKIAADLGGGALGAAYVVSSECKSTSCRVELEHPEAEKLERLFFELMPKASFSGTQLYTYQERNESGSGRMTIYIARSGHHFSPSKLAIE